MANAINLYGPGKDKKQPLKGKPAKARKHDPIHDRQKLLGDLMFEKIKALAEVLEPEVPSDSEPLDDVQVHLILETAAVNLSPHAWDDPAAIEDLIRLRKKFAPGVLETDTLKAVKRLAETDKRMVPDPSITPQSPEWKEQQKRLG